MWSYDSWSIKKNLLFQSGLPSGQYCDVISGNLVSGSCTGKTITVNGDGTVNVDLPVPGPDGDRVLAIHVEVRSLAKAIFPSYMSPLVFLSHGTLFPPWRFWFTGQAVKPSHLTPFARKTPVLWAPTSWKPCPLILKTRYTHKCAFAPLNLPRKSWVLVGDAWNDRFIHLSFISCICTRAAVIDCYSSFSRLCSSAPEHAWVELVRTLLLRLCFLRTKYIYIYIYIYIYKKENPLHASLRLSS
jgi:hypothetical protein